MDLVEEPTCWKPDCDREARIVYSIEHKPFDEEGWQSAQRIWMGRAEEQAVAKHKGDPDPYPDLHFPQYEEFYKPLETKEIARACGGIHLTLWILEHDV